MSAPKFHGIFGSLSGNKSRDATSDEDMPTMNRSPRRHAEMSSASTPNVGRVAVDIYEHHDYIIVKAPIAGVRLSDIDIEVNDNILTIRGERKQTDMIDDGQYYLRECFWGPFSRSITLPFAADARKIKASFNKECVLKILIPKEEKVRVVRISEG